MSARSITPKGQPVALTLVSVDINPKAGWDDMPRQPFTLILRGPPGDVLPEGLYDVAVEDGPDVRAVHHPDPHHFARPAGLPGRLQLTVQFREGKIPASAMQ